VLLCALTVARLVIRTQMSRQASTPMPTSCLPLKKHRYTSVSARKICARPWRFWGDARQPWAKYCGLRLLTLPERATVFQSAVCACCGSANCNAGAFCRLHTPPIFNGRDPQDWIVFGSGRRNTLSCIFPGGQTSSAVDLLGFNQLQARKL